MPFVDGPLYVCLPTGEKVTLDEYMERDTARLQAMLKLTGVRCTTCGNLGASAFEEGIHNTGECGCVESSNLCWREWWDTCQPAERGNGHDFFDRIKTHVRL